MGAACLVAAVISVASMFAMMGGKNAKLMEEYQAAQDRMSKAGTEYVRRIDPHVLMDQTAFVFQNNRLFKTSIPENVRAARPKATREEVEAALATAQSASAQWSL